MTGFDGDLTIFDGELDEGPEDRVRFDLLPPSAPVSPGSPGRRVGWAVGQDLAKFDSISAWPRSGEKFSDNLPHRT